MINPWVLSHSKKLLSVLLNSLWLGDGSSYKTDNTVANTITTVSPILARQIRDILILLGNRPSIYNVVAKTKPKNFKSIRPRYNIVWDCIKNEKYTQLQNCNSIAYKVKSKSYENYNGFVYNLEVEDDNSYSTENYMFITVTRTLSHEVRSGSHMYNNGYSPLRLTPCGVRAITPRATTLLPCWTR
jgi:intein/homing endonuclease